MLIAAILAVILVIFAMKSMVVVPDETAFVVERLGRYHRTLTAGRHFVAPFIDRVASRLTTRTAHNQLSETAITHDNVPVRVDSTFLWQIVDPARVAAGTADVDAFVNGVVRSQEREWVSRRLWQDLRETTRELESDVAGRANDAALTVGVQILEVNVQRVERV